jgi:FeS assembly protein IscX
MAAPKLKWTDSLDIAIELVEAHPDTDPVQIRFTALMAMVQALPDFDDAPERCGERVLEAIQQAWLGELS